MNDELYNMTEPSISANDGWHQMQTLLNEHLPIKRQIFNSNQQLPYVYTLTFLVIFLFSTLQLNNLIVRISAGGNVSRSILNAGRSPNTIGLNKNKPFLTLTNFPGNFTLIKKNTALLNFNEDPVWRINRNNSNIIIHNTTESNKESMMNDFIKRKPGNPVNTPVATIPGDAILPSKDPGNNEIEKSSWSLFGGIGLNASVSNSQNLQPYPFAEARYNITPHIYVAAGLSAWSPVSTGTSGISKTIYLNDTINNISLYNENTIYNHLHYTDIPLSVGINVTKNISIQSGIQMSVLLNKRTKKVSSPYDFQMNRISAPVIAPLTPMAANMQTDYDVRLHKIDYRFFAGIRYTLKKKAVGIMYQHGLQSIGSGIHTKKNSNHVFTLNVLFQIK
jgi:hypothetical protein